LLVDEMSGAPVNKLVEIEMFEASGVDHAANGPQIGAEGWLVMKSDGTKVGVVRTQSSQEAHVPGENEPTVEDLTKARDELTAQVATLTKERDDAIAQAKEAADKAAKPAEDEGKDELQKALDANPALKAAFEAQSAATKEALEKAEKAEAKAEVERDERLTKEFVAKAAELDQPADFGKVLREVAEKCSAETAGEMVRVVKAAVEQAKAATTLTLPSNPAVRMAGGSAWDQIVQKAEELIAADPKLDKAHAIDKARELNPDLVRKFREEMV
jgi:hypothetical protein